MPSIFITHSLPWRMFLTGDERGALYYPGKTRCPECGGPLTVDVNEWSARTGWPTACGVEVSCAWWEDAMLEGEAGDDEDDFPDHRWWQSDWQPVVDAVRAWARRHLRVMVKEDDHESL